MIRAFVLAMLFSLLMKIVSAYLLEKLYCVSCTNINHANNMKDYKP